MKNFLLSLVLIATLLLLVPVASNAQSRSVVQKAPTTTAMLLVAGNPNLISVLVQNVGSVNVAIGNSSSVTYSTAGTAGTQLAPSQQILCVGVTDATYAIAASGTADLRVTSITSQGGTKPNILPNCSVSRLITTGISNGASTANTVPMSDGTNLVTPNVLIYELTSAITANSTTTSTTAGSLAITSNATGIGSIFRSDGTNWQLLNNYGQYNASSTSVTVATTSTSDVYLQAPVTGSLTGVDFTSIDALAASDTNYITWTLVNLGAAGSGSTAMLAVADTNTTKTTGGTAITAVAKHSLVVHGTASNLLVTKGDILRLRATVTGTLAGTVTGSRCTAFFTRSV